MANVIAGNHQATARGRAEPTRSEDGFASSVTSLGTHHPNWPASGRIRFQWNQFSVFGRDAIAVQGRIALAGCKQIMTMHVDTDRPGEMGRRLMPDDLHRTGGWIDGDGYIATFMS